MLSAVLRTRHSMAPTLARRYLSIMRPAAGIQEPKTVSLIGAPFQYGQGLDGPEKAPKALRDAGLRQTITELGWRFVDRGDAEIVTPSAAHPTGEIGGKHGYAVCKTNENLHNLVASAANDGHFVLNLGGDHSMAMGTVAGILKARPNAGVIWVDAHADINLPTSSPSGNIHGMPVSFLMKLLKPGAVPGSEWLSDVPLLSQDRLVYVGLRSIDPYERKVIREHNVKAFSMFEVDKYGIGKVMEMALDHIAGKEERPIHMSYDIDAVDPAVAPSTGTTVKGGLNYREAHFVAECAADTGLLGSMDLVEVNPDIGAHEDPSMPAHTVEFGHELIASALGRAIL